MKYLKWAAMGLVPMVAFAFYLRSEVIAEREALKAFCETTHRGTRADELRARAALHDWDVVSTGYDGLLVEAEVFGYRMGCTVSIRHGEVEHAHFDELPARF